MPGKAVRRQAELFPFDDSAGEREHRVLNWLRRLRRRPRSLGRRGEAAAERFLKRLRYKIVGRSQRDRLGELDLIAVDLRGERGKTVVFVEVKTRSSHDSGHPAEAVDGAKQRRVTKVALGYLRRHGLLHYPTRFDVVAVTWPKAARKPQIEHFKNAFEPPGVGQMFN